MARSAPLKNDSFNIIASLLLILYLCIGFVPNWQAVDKIAPQWLVMSVLNLTSIAYFINFKKFLKTPLTLNIKSKLSLTYMAFIIWAIGSLFYAINPTEVLVNLARQLNVFFMFFSMAILTFSLKNKSSFLSWVIMFILSIELYAVFNEAIEMVNSLGTINGGQLKGVTANRNITAFSIAIKVPFVLYLIYINKKIWLKFLLGGIISAAFIAISMIQSRASFIAVGLIFISSMVMHTILYLKKLKKINNLLQITYVLIPLLLAIMINQTILSTKGADAVSRAATISLSKNDGSINQRLRYYEDVLTHLTSNPIFGVGLGNWKLKSIDYDSKDIDGYVVPYHAHSDFIQLGAELGIIGFLLYLGIFLLAFFYVYRLLRVSELNIDEKVFLFFALTSLGVYSIDANLNFPIARPQVLVVWALIIALITSYYLKEENKRDKRKSSSQLNTYFLVILILLVLPSIYINNSVFKSLKGQMILLQDFNSNQFNLPLNQVENVVPNIPNITVTTIPINSVKARYFVNAKKYDKALALLNEGTKSNPYLYYSEILKSQIFQEKGQLDSAKFYAKKAFFGLPNNDLHSTRYLNLINITRDRDALEEAFASLTAKNKLNNWKNYLIIASTLFPPKDKRLTKQAQYAMELFPGNQEFKGLYYQIVVGQADLNNAVTYSTKGLDYFNEKDYSKAAVEFEKAMEANPLDYAHFENAATANYLIGDLEKALDQINVVIDELNPLNGKCEYIKALIFIQMGDPIGACPLLATSRDSGYNQAKATFDQYCR
ncbi:O-antigen ligase family protein [Flavobacteriaceae bacterium]|nr:O-antigen ligase family protein [Flavobacteriaceae bacterium]